MTAVTGVKHKFSSLFLRIRPDCFCGGDLRDQQMFVFADIVELLLFACLHLKVLAFRCKQNDDASYYGFLSAI